RLSQFSADLAHDLRTPIGNLLGEAQVALSRRRTEGEYQSVLASSVEELERINRMIEGMLFLARTDNVQASLDLQTLDAAAEVDRLIEYYEGPAAEAGVAVRRAGALALQADAALFRRAISNLLANAIAHSTPRGEITVTLHAELDGGGEIAVTNSGPGIPPQALPRVFDRFFRVDASRLDSAKGSGLGLAIVKSIVELHGGGVEAQSEPGALTTFRMFFPRPASVTTPVAQQ
ncbi:MAG TPA: heavy metal sensor histidine kinase, partial [Burkholderiales bacterium]|nr:heavy metal sensor histidine kinase [Burkholderiales bacterium]